MRVSQFLVLHSNFEDIIKEIAREPIDNEKKILMLMALVEKCSELEGDPFCDIPDRIDIRVTIDSVQFGIVIDETVSTLFSVKIIDHQIVFTNTSFDLSTEIQED